MPLILSENDEFSPDITVPEGGDSRNAASVQPAFQKLTNRTRNVHNRVNVLEGNGPATTITRVVPPTRAVSMLDSGEPKWRFAGAAWTAVSPSGTALNYTFSLPVGSVLTRVRVALNQGAAASNPMQVEVYVREARVGTSEVDAQTQLGSTQQTSGTGADTLTVDSFSHTLAVDELIRVAINASDSGTSQDSVYSVEVQFDHTNPAAELVAL